MRVSHTSFLNERFASPPRRTSRSVDLTHVFSLRCRIPCHPPPNVIVASSRKRRRAGARKMTVAADKLAMREVIENWVIWRDSGNWERFRSVWHEEGRMMATWFYGTASE